MTRLYLIRHAETDWNVEGRWQGQADVPLNDNGIAQAAQIAQKLKDCNITAIYASDLTRTLQTAQELANLTGLPVIPDARLREIHQGKWQGLLVSEIQARYADEFQKRRENPLTVAPPGGETTRQVQQRVLDALSDIQKTHPTGTVAIVSHGFTIAVILAHYHAAPITSIWDFVPKNGEIQQLDV